ncbi:hypothetical protein [Patulibacter sp. SYSU D01012]|uniref:hypothetical protein n=1 Tax=Patulibacter sp. SYSU D01012 TaxID=2817381 RepID=UPI001B30FC2B|nr:hypothetical protein [Patulibacter sp. SYSU D01012]
MSNADSRTAVETAIKQLLEQVPALKPLKIVASAEVQGGRDIQLVRIVMPGPKVTKAMSPDARVTVEIRRDLLNELVETNDLQAWVRAWDHGRFRAHGVDEYLRLIGQVVSKTAAKQRALAAQKRG